MNDERHVFFQARLIRVLKTSRSKRTAAEAVTANPHEWRPAVFFISGLIECTVDCSRDIARGRPCPGRVQSELHRLLEDSVFFADNRWRLSEDHRPADLHKK